MKIKDGLPAFRASDSALYDFIQAFPEAAHLKDPQSMRYLCSNQHNLKIYGMENPRSIEGLTVFDLDGFMRPYWGDKFASKIYNFDALVVQQNMTMTDNQRVFLDKFGLIHFQNMTKTPISGRDSQVTAILTTSFDVTKHVSRFDIFKHYLEIYPVKRKACLHMMVHMNVDMFFNDVLTEKEMECLLHMIENKTHKNIANKMVIALRTAEYHVNNIINKLKSKTLSEILEFLRNVKSYEHA